jgi:predicted amidohydrolase YtcJ
VAGADVPHGLLRGPVKLLLADHDLPSLAQLAAWITEAHHHQRPVAVHCVTREALVLALAGWDEAGAAAGDRVEHGAVVDRALARKVAGLGLTVVTQPGFVAERGDRYLEEVDPADRGHLWPCRSLLEEAVRVGGGTDAPFGSPDPWRAVQAAVTRRTAAGQVLGASEAVDARRALALFLTDLTDPGGPVRRVRPGARADLCLLDGPLDEVLLQPSSEHVVLTVHGGEMVHAGA